MEINRPQQGLLQQAQQAPQPQQGQPQQGGEYEVSEQAQPFVRRAIEILYRDNFENLVQMIKTSWPDGLSSAVSTAINTTLKKLKKEMQMPPDVSAEVGVALFSMILEDMVMGGTIEQLDEHQLSDAIGKTMKDYMDANPGEVDPAELEMALAQAQQGG